MKIDPRLVEFLKEHLNKTATKEELKQILLSKGWDEAVIDDAIDFVESLEKEVVEDVYKLEKEIEHDIKDFEKHIGDKKLKKEVEHDMKSFEQKVSHDVKIFERDLESDIELAEKKFKKHNITLFIILGLLVIILALLLYIKLGMKTTHVLGGVDVGACEAIQNETAKSNCFVDLAVETKNKLYCLEVSHGLREICYKKIAEATNDVFYCNYIEVKDVKDQCIASVSA